MTKVKCDMRVVSGAIAASAILFSVVRAAETNTAPNRAANAANPGATCTATTGVFTVNLKLEGLLMPAQSVPVAIALESWKELTVLTVVPHGTRVKPGEVLVTFDTQGVDDAIETLRAESALKALELRRAELDLKLLEESLDPALADARLALDRAEEDGRLYRETDRPIEEAKSARNVRLNDEALLYEKEELNQLQKMYKADELTEETEEIILTRQRNTVRYREELAKEADTLRARQAKVDLARRGEDLVRAVDQQTRAQRAAEATRPMDIEKKRLELEALRHAERTRSEKLARLERDRDRLTLLAPVGGVVYYGRFLRADWVTGDADKHLQPGGHPPQYSPLLTIVTGSALEAHVWLKEQDVEYVPGIAAGYVVPKGFPTLRIPAALTSCADVPTMKGWYLTVFAPALADVAAPLHAGMSIAVHVCPYVREDAVTVPAASVFDDAHDDTLKYVHVLTAGGSHERRDVKPGHTFDGRTEILSGLNAGDKVLLKRPE